MNSTLSPVDQKHAAWISRNVYFAVFKWNEGRQHSLTLNVARVFRDAGGMPVYSYQLLPIFYPRDDLQKALLSTIHGLNERFFSQYKVVLQASRPEKAEVWKIMYEPSP